MLLLSVVCFSCFFDAALVGCVLVWSFLKVAFGHLSFNNPGVLVNVVNRMLLSFVACYSCLLDATLLCCVPLLSLGCYSCRLGACLVIFEGGLRPPFFHNPGVLVCVVNWMLLSSVVCYSCPLDATVVCCVLLLCLGCYSCRLSACLVVFEGGLRPPFFNSPGVLVCVVNWMLPLYVVCYSCLLDSTVGCCVRL